MVVPGREIWGILITFLVVVYLYYLVFRNDCALLEFALSSSILVCEDEDTNETMVTGREVFIRPSSCAAWPADCEGDNEHEC